ncbi:MAG: DUF3368 domain-containing protein [Gemmatales bacterium]
MVTHWVVNASPVILLGKTGQLELLRHLGSHIVIPEAAVREVEGRPYSDVSVQALSTATWLNQVAVNVIPEDVASFGLGDGEAEVLTYALAQKGTGAILDDQAARHAATQLGIPHVGTLGVVVFAKVHGLIPSAKDVIEQLRQHGMYLSDKVMARALAQVGE